MDNADAVPEGILAFFSSAQKGVRLPEVLARGAALYTTTTLELASVEEVKGLGREALEACIIAGDDREGEMAAPLLIAIRHWAAAVFAPAQANVVNVNPNQVGEVNNNEEAPRAMVNNAARGDHLTKELETDMGMMDLNEADIKALSLSIATGVSCTPFDVADMPYGSDPQLSDLMKRRNKSNMDSLQKHLDAKDTIAVTRHFSELIRDLTASGKTKEVSVITSWFMEVQQVFAGSPAAMLVYIKEYLRRYRGRAFPVKFDYALFAKALADSAFGKGASALSDDQKEVLKNAKALTGKVNTLVEQAASYKTKISELQSELRILKSNRGSGSGRGEPLVCNFCGKEGHIATKCKLNPKSANYDANYAAKHAADDTNDE